MKFTLARRSTTCQAARIYDPVSITVVQDEAQQFISGEFMNIHENWEMIKGIVQVSMKSSHHLSFATVNEDGFPHITPIGSLILRDDCTGYYFEEYTKQMPINLRNNQRISILAVNSGFWFWIKAIYSGKFSSHPGIRLHGKVGDRRPATDGEIDAWQ